VLDAPRVPFGASLANLGLRDSQVDGHHGASVLDTNPYSRRIAASMNLTKGELIPRRQRTIELFDDGRHQDGGKRDGIFGALVPVPPVDGVFNLTFIAEGRTARGEKFLREFRRAVVAPVRVDPEASTIEVERVAHQQDWITKRLPNPALPDPSNQRYRVRITPRDKAGLLLGPGYSERIRARLAVSDRYGKRRSPLNVLDLGDGSYQMSVATPNETRWLHIDVEVEGVELPRVVLIRKPIWWRWLAWWR
jgi:hypothetical protein